MWGRKISVWTWLLSKIISLVNCFHSQAWPREELSILNQKQNSVVLIEIALLALKCTQKLQTSIQWCTCILIYLQWNYLPAYLNLPTWLHAHCSCLILNLPIHWTIYLFVFPRGPSVCLSLFFSIHQRNRRGSIIYSNSGAIRDGKVTGIL